MILINLWVQEDSGFGLWMTMRFNPNQDRYPKLVRVRVGLVGDSKSFG